MQQDFKTINNTDNEGNPAGGTADAIGVQIRWQNGPLRQQGNAVSDVPAEPNGAFVETVIAIALDRIEFYQGSKFACDDNAEALEHLDAALKALNRRTVAREERGVEGTHEV